MNVDEEITNPFYDLPTEILIKIFYYLPGVDLVRCRQICVRWKLIIDDLMNDNYLWADYCRKEFNDIFFYARCKFNADWHDLYRSLTLWPRLKDAVEEIDEFASAQRYNEEVQSLQIVDRNKIAIHKKCGIQFYDVNTLKLTARRPITGDFAMYAENVSTIVVQNYQLHLFVIRNYPVRESEEKMKMFFHVKMCLLTDYELFFVNLDNEVHFCDYTNNDAISSTVIFRAEVNDYVISLGHKDDCLSILTFERKIYTITKNKEVKHIKTITNNMNILNTLHEFHFLKLLDWRVYFQWMFVLNHSAPEGPLRNLIIIRPYGDVFFVGTNSGVLSIFYRPYIDGELDLFRSEPLRQINFMERADIPILSTCPIIQIDVMEVINGHTVFVAMPKKVAVLKYKHDFMRYVTRPWVLCPFDVNYVEI